MKALEVNQQHPVQFFPFSGDMSSPKWQYWFLILLFYQGYLYRKGPDR